MSVSVNSLNYPSVFFPLDGKNYRLRKFDLMARAWAYDEFSTKEQPDGNQVLADRLKANWADLPAVSKTIWHLLESDHKDEFGTYEDFLKAIEKSKRETSLIITDMYHSLIESLQKASPTEDDLGEEAELKKSRAAIG